MILTSSLVVLHLEDRSLRLVDPDEIFWLEADGDDTLVRLRGSQRLRDRRALGGLASRLAKRGFVRIHRSHAVNLARVSEGRRRAEGDGWEVKLNPPVNKVLPVSEEGRRVLWAALGEIEAD